MSNHGEASVEMTDELDHCVHGTFAVTDVTRPLQSVSKIADKGFDVIFSATEARVEKDGKVYAVYPRRGGLYVRTVRMRTLTSGSRPRTTVARPKAKAASRSGTGSGFPRPGARR